MWPRHTEPSLGFFRIGIKLTLPHTFHEWKNARTLSCHSIDSCSWSLPSCHHRRVAMGSDRVASVCKCSHTFLRCIRDGVWLGAQCVAFDVMYACVQCDRCRCFSLSFLMRVLPFISLRIVGFLFNGHHRTYVERLESGVCVTLWHVCCPQPQHTHTVKKLPMVFILSVCRWSRRFCIWSGIISYLCCIALIEQWCMVDTFGECVCRKLAYDLMRMEIA